MAANLVRVDKRKAEREAAPAVLGVATLTESHEVREDVRLAPAREVPERNDVVNLKAVLAGQFAATLTALAVALSRPSRLCSPVRAIVRLVAALPKMIPFRIIAKPLVPTGRGTEAAHIFAHPGPGRQRFALFAGVCQGRHPVGAWLALLGRADARTRRGASLLPRHHLGSMFRCVALPGTEKASVNLAGYLRREQIERSAARLAATILARLMGAPPALARTIRLRVALERALPARDDLAARGARNLNESMATFNHASMLPQVQG